MRLCAHRAPPRLRILARGRGLRRPTSIQCTRPPPPRATLRVPHTRNLISRRPPHALAYLVQYPLQTLRCLTCVAPSVDPVGNACTRALLHGREVPSDRFRTLRLGRRRNLKGMWLRARRRLLLIAKAVSTAGSSPSPRSIRNSVRSCTCPPKPCCHQMHHSSSSTHTRAVATYLRSARLGEVANIQDPCCAHGRHRCASVN
jgi:hypothetical protein